MSGEISEQTVRAINRIEVNLSDKGTLKATVLDAFGTNLFVSDLNMAQLNKLLESIYNVLGSTLSDLIMNGELVTDPKVEYVYGRDANKFNKIKVIAREKLSSLSVVDIDQFRVKVVGKDLTALVALKSGDVVRLDGIDSINDLLEAYYASGISNAYELIAKHIFLKDSDFDSDYEFGDAKKINKKNKDVLASIDSVEYETKANGTVVGKIKYTDGTSRNIISVDDINAIFDLFYRTGSFNNITDILATGKVKKIGDLTTAFEYSADNKHISKKITSTLAIDEITAEAKTDKTVTGTIKFVDGTTKPIANITEFNDALDKLYAQGIPGVAAADLSFAKLIANNKVHFTADTSIFEFTDGKHLRDKTVIDKDIDMVEFETKSDGTLTGTIKFVGGTTKPIANIGEYNAALDKLYAQGLPGVADADLNIAKLIASNKVITRNPLDINVFKYVDGKHLSVVAKIVEKIVLDVKADGTIVQQVQYMDGTTKDLADMDEINEEIKKLSKANGKNLTELMADGLIVASDAYKNKYDVKRNKKFTTKKTKKSGIKRLVCYGIVGVLLLTGGYILIRKSLGKSQDNNDDLTRGNNDDQIEQNIDAPEATEDDEAKLTVYNGDTFNLGSDEDLILGLAAQGEDLQTAIPVVEPTAAPESHYGSDSELSGPNIRDPKVNIYDNAQFGSMSQDSMEDQINYMTQLFLGSDTVNATTFENMIAPEDRATVKPILDKRDDVDYGRCSAEEFMTDYVHYVYYDEGIFDGKPMKSDEDLKPFTKLAITYCAKGVNAKCADGVQIGDTEFTKDTLGNSLDGDVDYLNRVLLEGENRLGH